MLTGQSADKETHSQSIRRLVNLQTRRVMQCSTRGPVNSAKCFTVNRYYTGWPNKR